MYQYQCLVCNKKINTFEKNLYNNFLEKFNNKHKIRAEYQYLLEIITDIYNKLQILIKENKKNESEFICNKCFIFLTEQINVDKLSGIDKYKKN